MNSGLEECNAIQEELAQKARAALNYMAMVKTCLEAKISLTACGRSVVVGIGW
jgi:hypothetical protein